MALNFMTINTESLYDCEKCPNNFYAGMVGGYKVRGWNKNAAIKTSC